MRILIDSEQAGAAHVEKQIIVVAGPGNPSTSAATQAFPWPGNAKARRPSKVRVHRIEVEPGSLEILPI